MLRGFISLYSWRYPQALMVLLQRSRYNAASYLAKFWCTTDFSSLAKEYKPTKTRKTAVLMLRVGIILEIAAGLVLLGLWKFDDMTGYWQLGIATIMAYPIVIAHILPVGGLVWRLTHPAKS